MSVQQTHSHEVFRFPITAVHLLLLLPRRVLLVGEGPFLRLVVFDNDDDDDDDDDDGDGGGGGGDNDDDVPDSSTAAPTAAAEFGRYQVFASQAIHGFAVLRGSNSSSSSSSSSGRFSVLVWGGRLLCVVRVRFLEGRDDPLLPRRGGGAVVVVVVVVVVGPAVTAEDWIFDVAVCPPAGLREGGSAAEAEEGKNTIVSTAAVAITAHNLVLQVSLVTPDGDGGEEGLLPPQQLSIRPLVRGQKSILYSAHLQWLERGDRILVAAGTAFGEILVWSFAGERPETTVQLHHIFTGHEGSVFGVRISERLVPEQVGLGDVRLVLASCSDDRTVRLWDISDVVCPPGSTTENSPRGGDELSAKDTGMLRETGFGANFNDDDSADDRCLAVAWGHMSRIWQVHFLLFRSDDDDGSKTAAQERLELLSVGEDATSQVWSVQLRPGSSSDAPQRQRGGSDRPWRLEHQRTLSHHSGKNIWAVAITGTGSDSFTVVTGAADGKMMSYRVWAQDSMPDRGWSNKVKSMRRFQLPLSSNGMQIEGVRSLEKSELSKKKVAAGSDSFRSFDFLDEHTLIVATNHGCILKYNLKKDPVNGEMRPGQFHEVLMARFDDLKGFSTLKRSPLNGAVFIASSQGVLRYYQSHRGVSELANIGGIVTALFVERFKSTKYSNCLSLLLTRAGSQPSHHILVQWSSTMPLQVLRQMDLSVEPELPAPRVITSIVHCEIGSGSELLILGGRNGTIAIYHFKSPETNFAAVSKVSLLHRVHGEEAVTSMLWLDKKNTAVQADCDGWLYSVGCDGRINVHRCDFALDAFLLVHSVALPFGPNAEGLYVHTVSRSVIVYGFHSKAFVVYDISNGMELVRVKCEGSHRSWSFHPYVDEEQGVGAFAWNQAAKVNVCESTSPSHRVIWPGGHGREVKACAITAATPIMESRSPLIATGAEDTDILISTIEDGRGGSGKVFKSAAVLRKHVTGIQQLEWSDDGQYLFSSGGFEEFYIWRIRPLPLLRIGIVCESECPVGTDVPDLRITDFAVQAVRDSKHGGGSFVISLVYSDSTVKVFCYSSVPSPKWDLIHVGNYTSCCVTQTHVLSSHLSSILVTAATDGHIALWDTSNESLSSIKGETGGHLPNTIEWHSRARLHQNTIKTLSLITITLHVTLVLTGGDDNAVCISLLHHPSSSAANISSRDVLRIPRAHAAAVTASALILDISKTVGEHEGRLHYIRAITASIDQTVKIWGIKVDLSQRGVEGVDVEKVAEVFTPVADVSSLSIVPGSLTEVEDSDIRVLVCGVGMDLIRFRV